MAKKVCKQEEENLRNQLAAAVRSIQWSYAIFWCPSSKDQGVLQWGEGYYNGDIKTRRTVLNMDLKADQTGCQRSDQLRELYESLLSGTSNTKQARRPLAALSPEDLTNVEWYYMVCMSFVFNVGQGLPGKCVANGRTIWLCSAHCADTGLFCRSLLAKSAGIKTVVCFPFASGVIELGVTEVVKEDNDLIQHVKTTFLENSSQFVSWEVNYMPELICGDDIHVALQGEDVEALSPSGSSNEAEPIQPSIDHMFLFEGLSCEASPANLIMEDELSNCIHTSMTSSECISQSIVNPDNVPSSPRNEVSNNPNFQEKGLNKGRDHWKSNSLHPSTEDFHYQNVLSSLLNESNQLVVGLPSQALMNKKSSFGSWKSEGAKTVVNNRAVNLQSMLKKALFEVPRMHSARAFEPKDNGGRKDVTCKQELDVANTNHVLAERRRREKVNERFSILRSLIPSITKVDKVSILDDTIAYLKELERKVEELESCQDQSNRNEMKKKRRALDVEERTSDNYGNDINLGAKNKRKARVVSEEQAQEFDGQQVSTIDNTITISMVEKDITINVRCPWRESLLLEIIDTISSLNIDSHSVQSSTVDGILSLAMNSRLKGCSKLSIGLITQALQRVIRKC